MDSTLHTVLVTGVLRYAIPGLDYVAHEDILPYTTSETSPLQHELFDKFLMYEEGRGVCYLPTYNYYETRLRSKDLNSNISSCV